MSRREDRSSDARRPRSRLDRESSPKRSRTDAKVKPERPPVDTKLDKDRDLDHKHHRRLRDRLPLESPLAVSKDTDKKINGPPEDTKRSSDPTKVPQSRSYFQACLCMSYNSTMNVVVLGKMEEALPVGQTKKHGWRRDSKEHQNNRTEVKAATSNVNDEKSKDNRDENHVWRHDGYFRMEANPKPPTRKRPAFREQKAPADPGKTDKAASNTATPNIQDRAVESEKGDERRFNSKLTDRPERPSARNRELAKGEAARSDSRDRYGGVSSRYRGRERFNPRQGYYRTGGGRVEKWKHDLYDEANKSPNLKNEEDQISKIEALLAS
ncbi:hypothetical protein OROHE_026736 [Orobanche hederae]